jgi:hypothetical protein
MAKSKAKGRTKLPKTIAGVKVPKALRKSGGSICFWQTRRRGRSWLMC